MSTVQLGNLFTTVQITSLRSGLQIATILRRINPAVVLALVCCLPRPAAAQDSSVTGRLHVVWEDPQSPNDPARMHFFLADEQSRWTELRIPAHVRQRIGEPMSLAGRYVRVTGLRLPATTPGLASAITEVNAVELTTAPAGAPSLDIQSDIVSGTQSWVTVLCSFDRSSSTPHSPSWYEQLMGSDYPGVGDFWREVSFNALEITGNMVVGWYDLPSRRSAYINNDGTPNLEKLKDDCSEAADADIHFPAHVGIHFQFNETIGCCSWGGTMSLDRDGENRVYAMTWMAPWADQLIYAHEMGHGLGLDHSSGPYGTVYDSDWDVMSRGHTYRDGTFGWIAPHTISYHKQQLGWIDPARLYIPAQGSVATIGLHRLGESANADGYHMAKIPLAGDAFYTVEARRFYGYDGSLPGEAIVLHHVDPSRAEPAHVVDPDNDGDPNDAGAMWLPGETFTDAANGVRVSVLSGTSNGFEVEIEVGNVGTDPEPRITLTPTSLAYETTEGTNPLDQSFSVMNDGGGTLDYTVSSNRTWLSLSRTSGNLSAGVSQNVSVGMDASGLTAGSYDGTITIAGNGENGPQTVAVSVTVNEQPVAPRIVLTPTSLAYETTVGTNPLDKSFTVKNDGEGILEYTASSNRNWLDVSRTSGSLGAGATQSVAVSVDASGISAGTQSGTITIGGNGENAPQTVAVSVTVTEKPGEPLIAVGPSSLDFQIKGNKATGPKKLGVQNAGSQDLNWNASSNQSWLKLGKSSGTLSSGSTDSLSVEVSLTGLEPGTYDATIEVAGNADNSPQSVKVQLKLTKGGVVKLKKGRLTFAGSTEEEPLAAYVLLENDGDAPAEWSASTDQEWVELETMSGSLVAGETTGLALRVDITSLSPGHHSASIEFAGGDDELPDTLQVELMVTDGPGVRHGPEQAAAHLLGAGASLGSDELDYIDFVGNGNGRFDVGDLRAWLIQAGELGADAPLLSLEAAYASQPESTSEGLPAVSRESAERRD